MKAQIRKKTFENIKEKYLWIERGSLGEVWNFAKTNVDRNQEKLGRKNYQAKQRKIKKKQRTLKQFQKNLRQTKKLNKSKKNQTPKYTKLH